MATDFSRHSLGDASRSDRGSMGQGYPLHPEEYRAVRFCCKSRCHTWLVDRNRFRTHCSTSMTALKMQTTAPLVWGFITCERKRWNTDIQDCHIAKAPTYSVLGILSPCLERGIMKTQEPGTSSSFHSAGRRVFCPLHLGLKNK